MPAFSRSLLNELQTERGDTMPMPDTFQNFVCWKVPAVRAVMDTEALQIPDHVFLAVHHPVRMVKQGMTDAAVRTPYDQEAFLREFLDPQVDFRFVPVLGESGTGKSHLIRWLKANIPEVAGRRVILIPKAGTNLRGVLQLILEGMEGPRFDSYRERLGRVAMTMSNKEGQAHLLGSLARVVEFRGNEILKSEGEDADRQRRQAQDYVLKHLHHLLNDPFFRNKWLRTGGVIERIYDITLGHSQERERRDQVRQFTREDLPLNLADVTEAARAAQGFFRQLNTQPVVQEATLDVLNAGLDPAIHEVLSLSGEDLLQLMLEVRRALAEQNTELFLLIEDFAKLQGIDRQLLEALLVRPSQQGDQLCAMRTALACTNGYYENFADTVRTRASFRVDLNIDTDDGKAEIELHTFAARYLNAVRVGGTALAKWYAEGAIVAELPNACAECPFQNECHPAFGAREEWGIYPFTAAALDRMYDRTQAQGFNPRYLINDVLRYLLEQHAPEIEDGRFPPNALHAHFGGLARDFDVREVNRIRQRDPENASRRLALLDLWTEEQRAVNLDPRIHQAFSLPPLSSVEAATVETEASRHQPPEPTRAIDPKERQLQEHIRVLNAWGGGDVMPQVLGQHLRNLLYKALTSYVDWDAEHLLQGAYCSATGSTPFRVTSIDFRDQQTAEAPREIKLLVPHNADDVSRAEVAQALQGLLKYQHHGHWNFDHGSQDFRVYAKWLDGWATELVAKIRRLGREDGKWNPVPAAVELVSIGARLAGRPPISQTSMTDRWEAIFHDFTAVDVSTRSDAWRRLFKAYQKHQRELLDIIEAHALCPKGSSRQIKYFDVGQFYDVIASIGRNGWEPTTDVPEVLPKLYEPIAKVREALDQREEAIAQERERYEAWLEQVKAALGEERDGKVLTAAVREAMTRAQEAGASALTPQQKEKLDHALYHFARVDYASARGIAERVGHIGEDEPNLWGRLAGELGRECQHDLQVTETFIEQALPFIDRTKERLKREVEELESAESGDLGKVIDTIGADMSELQALLETVQHGAAIPVDGQDTERVSEEV
jgi:hypothetical protein